MWRSTRKIVQSIYRHIRTQLFPVYHVRWVCVAYLFNQF